MGLFGGKPSTPAPRPGVPASPAPKWPSKPTSRPLTKPDLSKKGTGGTIKQQRWQMMQEARMGKIVIPGTGGKKMTAKQVEDFFKQPGLSYKKVGTALNQSEKIRRLRDMRRQDKGNLQSMQGRLRRVFEERWGLKGGRDY